MRADAAAVDNLGGWLTTVIAHVCLDILRARKTRENAAPAMGSEGAAAAPEPADPERELLLADAVGSAMMIVLDTLSPPERVAFVLHDLFALSFEDIGAIVGRSAVATRQLASRARRRVQGASERENELPSQREVAASLHGCFARRQSRGAARRAQSRRRPARRSRRRESRSRARSAGRAASRPRSARRRRRRSRLPRPRSGRAARARRRHAWRSVGARWPRARRLRLQGGARPHRRSAAHRRPEDNRAARRACCSIEALARADGRREVDLSKNGSKRVGAQA